MTPFQYIDRHTADLVDLLQRLIRIPTVNPPGDNYAAMTALLVRELHGAGLQARRFPIPRSLARRALVPEWRTHPRYNVLGFRATPAPPRPSISTPITMWCPPAAAGGTGVRSLPRSKTAGSTAAAPPT